MKAGYSSKELCYESMKVDKILSEMTFYPDEDDCYLSVQVQIEELLEEIKNNE